MDHHKAPHFRHTLHPETLMMGFGYDPALSEGSVKVPYFQTSTFVFRSAQHGKDFFELIAGLRDLREGETPGLIYSRFNNPDLEISKTASPSGKAPKRPGVRQRHGRHRNHPAERRPPQRHHYLQRPHLRRHRNPADESAAPIRHPRREFAANAGPAEIEARVAEARASLAPGGRICRLHAETPANPTNDLVDIAHCAGLAASLADQQGGRPTVIVDNTFLGPLWQRPLDRGADMVIHSLTKYIGGHSDLVAAPSSAARRPEAIRSMRSGLGTLSDPHTGWLLMRSLETLELRMTRQRKRRQSGGLPRQPPRHRAHRLFGPPRRRQPRGGDFPPPSAGPGSTISVYVKGGEAEAFRFLDRLVLIKLAVSLGGTESLASHPAGMTHIAVPEERKKRFGLSPTWSASPRRRTPGRPHRRSPSGACGLRKKAVLF